MIKQTVVTMKLDFLGDKEEAERKALRLIRRETAAGRIIIGTIEEVGKTYEVKE